MNSFEEQYSQIKFDLDAKLRFLELLKSNGVIYNFEKMTEQLGILNTALTNKCSYRDFDLSDIYFNVHLSNKNNLRIPEVFRKTDCKYIFNFINPKYEELRNGAGRISDDNYYGNENLVQAIVLVIFYQELGVLHSKFKYHFDCILNFFLSNFPELNIDQYGPFDKQVYSFENHLKHLNHKLEVGICDFCKEESKISLTPLLENICFDCVLDQYPINSYRR